MVYHFNFYAEWNILLYWIVFSWGTHIPILFETYINILRNASISYYMFDKIICATSYTNLIVDNYKILCTGMKYVFHYHELIFMEVGGIWGRQAMKLNTTKLHSMLLDGA